MFVHQRQVVGAVDWEAGIHDGKVLESPRCWRGLAVSGSVRGPEAYTEEFGSATEGGGLIQIWGVGRSQIHIVQSAQRRRLLPF